MQICRAKAGECDKAEMCTGDGPKCPDDKKEPATKVRLFRQGG